MAYCQVENETFKNISCKWGTKGLHMSLISITFLTAIVCTKWAYPCQ